jgi:hypothetical protein
MAIFFQNSKTKISIQISKMIFSKIFHFKFSLWHKQIFSLARGCQIYYKIAKITYLPLSKIVKYCIPPLGDMVHRKRALFFYLYLILWTYVFLTYLMWCDGKRVEKTLETLAN